MGRRRPQLTIMSSQMVKWYATIHNARFRLTHKTSFVKAHTSFWTKLPIFFCVGCFFRQSLKFFGKADYLALSNGFIEVHFVPASKFDFQNYRKRSLEDDFKIIMGVR
ncbi:hypothetical protein IC575_029635 [Cucumis melo]